MHGWQHIIVLTFLVLQNSWTFVVLLLILSYRGFILYAPRVHGLCPSLFSNEIDLLIIFFFGCYNLVLQFLMIKEIYAIGSNNDNEQHQPIDK
jgi:hypothetical protein